MSEYVIHVLMNVKLLLLILSIIGVGISIVLGSITASNWIDDSKYYEDEIERSLSILKYVLSVTLLFVLVLVFLP